MAVITIDVYKRQLLILAFCLGWSLAANAELALKEIRTASKDVLVAYFKSTKIDANEVNTTNLASWKLDVYKRQACGRSSIPMTKASPSRLGPADLRCMRPCTGWIGTKNGRLFWPEDWPRNSRIVARNCCPNWNVG